MVSFMSDPRTFLYVIFVEIFLLSLTLVVVSQFFNDAVARYDFVFALHASASITFMIRFFYDK